MSTTIGTVDEAALAKLLAGELPDARGRFGPYGGRYVPETLVPALDQLERDARALLADEAFIAELHQEMRDFIGRPTALTLARGLSEQFGAEIWLKREDLAHTGAHKINNALGQALIAKRAGAQRIIAETGAGQHGVASAAACARVGLPCRVYMGALDVERQSPNVDRMRRLGAEVVAVESGDRTLRSAIDEALRDWVGDPGGTYYLLGSAVGPHPYPWLVRELQAVIGREAREQMLERGGLPDVVIACVGGGSNAIGLFHPFLGDREVTLLGIEAGGDPSGQHSATLRDGGDGVLHGSLSLLLQNHDGQVQGTHSCAPGLDYPGVGPEHAFLRSIGRVRYASVDDRQALAALDRCCRDEGILPAIESSHAVAGAALWARQNPGARILVGLSGRGDKDMPVLEKLVPMLGDESVPADDAALAVDVTWAEGSSAGSGAEGPASETGRGVAAAGANRASASGTTGQSAGQSATGEGSTAQSEPGAELEKALTAAGAPTICAYLTGGYPDRQRFAALLDNVARAADAVEIGVPFSDPMADGLTIQRSSRIALEGGITLEGILEAVRAHTASRSEATPIVLMSYLNPLLAYGPERLAADARAAGVDGFVVPDLPLEECDVLRVPFEIEGVALVQLVTPATPPERMRKICAESRGFVYAVTVTGITGRDVALPDDLVRYLSAVSEASHVPVLAGFGIRQAQQVRDIGKHADGVVVGSALIEAIDRGEDPAERVRGLRG